MITKDFLPPRREEAVLPPDGACTELQLLLPATELAALEEAATHDGISIGHWLRRLIRQHLSRAQP